MASFNHSMMKACLTLFLVGSFGVADGQGIPDARIQSEIERSGIDTLLIYTFRCSGCSTSDPCKKEPSQYLFFKQEGHSLVKRFDYCEDYQSLKIDSDNPFDFYLRNIEAIETDEVRPPTFQQVIRNGERLDTIWMYSSREHSFHHTFSFRFKDRVVQKVVDVYDLQFEKTEQGFMNIHYDSNRKTAIYALILQMRRFIEEIEEENGWQ